jgi:hypothetical protein
MFFILIIGNIMGNIFIGRGNALDESQGVIILYVIMVYIRIHNIWVYIIISIGIFLIRINKTSIILRWNKIISVGKTTIEVVVI